MRRPPLDRIPLALAAAFVALCSVITIWNVSVAAAFPRLAIRNWGQLYGLLEEKLPTPTLSKLLSGDVQAAFSRQIGIALPIYASAVRTRNQIDYSLFGLTNAPSIVFGRDKWLYEGAYIKEYCERSDDVDVQALARWGDNIKEIQDYAVSHGKAFLYMITPSKAAIYPEHLPDGRACASVSRATTNKLPHYERALKERGVRYLNASSLIAAEREQHGISLFPRGGTHWNALGAALAVSNVVSQMKAQRPGLDLGGIRTDWVESRNPVGTDRDLVYLLNLYWFDADYSVPRIISSSTEADGACRPAKISEIGGSFLEQINVALRESRCPPDISYWFYWNFAHVSYVEDKRRSEPARDAERPADLAGSDAILLEENEMNIGETEHLKALHALVASAARVTSAREGPPAR